MKVILQNYSRGQTVYHSKLIILKGQLVVDCGDDQEQAGNISCAGAGGTGTSAAKFEIRHQRNPQQHDDEMAAVVVEETVPHLSCRSRFVAVLWLGHGANKIKFVDKENGLVFDDFELIYQSDTSSNEYYIRMLYVTSAKNGETKCSGRNMQQEILPKLELGLSLVQTLFAEKLFENGFDKRSFKLTQPCDKIDFPINLGPEEIAQMSTSQLWEYIAKEIRSREDVWDRRCKYVAFIANSWQIDYEHHQHSGKESGGAGDTGEKLALGGGGLAVIGTSFLDVWPSTVEKILDTLFSDKNLWSKELDASAARFGAVDRTEGSLYAASLGSVMHEMGHIFDLGHTDAGLMGSQFNRIDTCLSPVLSYPPVCELFRPKLGSDVSSLLRPKVGVPTSGCLSEDLLSVGTSCATLLYFHKWFQRKPNNATSGENNIMLFKNKVVSKGCALVTIQVRDTEDERLLKSWTFVEKASRENSDPVIISSMQEFTLAKNHIPLPVCQRGDSSKALVVAEDCEGNLMKAVVSRDSLSESFTVIRRRT